MAEKVPSSIKEKATQNEDEFYKPDPLRFPLELEAARGNQPSIHVVPFAVSQTGPPLPLVLEGTVIADVLA